MTPLLRLLLVLLLATAAHGQSWSRISAEGPVCGSNPLDIWVPWDGDDDDWYLSYIRFSPGPQIATCVLIEVNMNTTCPIYIPPIPAAQCTWCAPLVFPVGAVTIPLGQLVDVIILDDWLKLPIGTTVGMQMLWFNPGCPACPPQWSLSVRERWLKVATP